MDKQNEIDVQDLNKIGNFYTEAVLQWRKNADPDLPEDERISDNEIKQIKIWARRIRLVSKFIDKMDEKGIK